MLGVFSSFFFGQDYSLYFQVCEVQMCEAYMQYHMCIGIYAYI